MLAEMSPSATWRGQLVENGPAHGDWDYPIYEGFHGHGGTPIAGWFMSWKIPSRSGWYLGVPPFQETSIWHKGHYTPPPIHTNQQGLWTLLGWSAHCPDPQSFRNSLSRAIQIQHPVEVPFGQIHNASETTYLLDSADVQSDWSNPIPAVCSSVNAFEGMSEKKALNIAEHLIPGSETLWQKILFLTEALGFLGRCYRIGLGGAW